MIQTTPTAPEPQRFYLPQLDGLRFIAFLLVFWFHGGLPPLTWALQALADFVGPWLPGVTRSDVRGFAYRVSNNGWVGVQLFFILSGYLITTLLLREESRYGRIRLRAFWMRRILRIWPLYYWVVFLGFFVLPLLNGGFGSLGHRQEVRRHLPWFLLFLGNWSMALLGPVGSDNLSILWSVCVEEQFYIVAPLLIACTPRRARLAITVALTTAAIAYRAWLAPQKPNMLFFSYNSLTHIDTLSSGALLALLLNGRVIDAPRAAWRSWLIWPILAAGALLLARPGLARSSPRAMTWDYVAFWIAGAALVAHLATTPSVVRSLLSHPRMVWLGRISYGLYMYHEIAIWLGGRGAAFIGWFPFDQAITSFANLALCIGIAALSYRYLEQPFLKLKHRWSRVESRPI